MKNLDDIAHDLAESVAAQTDAIKRGDHKTGNQYAKKYIKAFSKLREVGDLGREALIPLLKHDRSDVRVMVASFLLRYRTQEAQAVLEAEARGQGIVAFEAGEALRRWREGTWALDPP